MSARRVVIALFAALAATGCRALNVSPARPEAVLPTQSLAVTQIVERHNDNAERVQSLEARPGVSDRKIAQATGMMALVRPYDFRLTIDSPRGQVADVGCNGQQYWIWLKGEQREYYVGRIDDQGEATPGLAFQPDWIIEALGLRLIPPDEMKRITTEKGDAATTITLVHHRTGAQGQARIKKTIVDKQSGQIREHRFYMPDNKTLLAQAFPSEYRSVPSPGADGKPGDSAVIPGRIRLITAPTPQDGSRIVDIMLSSSVKINQFNEQRRAALFQIPDFERRGFVRVDIDQQMSRAAAENSASANASGATTIRETKPSPPVNDRVRLGTPQPVSLGSESARRNVEPVPLVADLPESDALDAVVRGQMPRAVESTPAFGP